jgi:hypothetical protein
LLPPMPSRKLVGLRGLCCTAMPRQVRPTRVPPPCPVVAIPRRFHLFETLSYIQGVEIRAVSESK